MMIVDLIDGDDFRDRLVSLGISLPEGASPDACARMAQLMHAEVGVPGLQALVRELGEQTDIMLPSVRSALERFLLPVLR
ncbi:hypothetical protein [Litchfieldella xinjiangensis]|uniref:hypothetical protein n=1 Tax=Litchfieldella xinjiangensis TaxID=1166948 RepID=UPI0005BB3193|nr:hypothetical protein [Halomonas xinjiangensis]